MSAVRIVRAGGLEIQIREEPRSAMPGGIVGIVTMDEMKRRYAVYVLEQCGGNKTHAAKALGMDRRSLYRILDSEVQSCA